MKKYFIFVLILAAVSLTACGKDETAPIIDGVAASVTITQGESFNAMENLIVTDDNDEDLWDQVQLSTLSGLEENNGVFTPQEAGTYYITYSVSDKAGNHTEAYMDLVVLEKLTEEVYMDFDFSQQGTVDYDNWNLKVNDGATAKISYIPGAVQLNIEEAGENTNDVKYQKNDISVEKGATYDIVLKAKSDVPVTFHFVANDVNTDWNPLGSSAWNLVMSESYQEYKLTFIAEEDSQTVEAFLEFGGDLTQSPFVVTIDDIKIVKTTGAFKAVEQLLEDCAEGSKFGTNGDETIERPVQSVVSVENEQVVLSINDFGSAVNPWEFNFYYASGVDLEEGASYILSLDYEADAEQVAELCLEGPDMDWQNRAGFENMTFLEGQHHHELTFIAGCNMEDLYIKFALGAGDGKKGNQIKVDNIKLDKLEGDKTVEEKTVDFRLEGLPYASYHGGEGAGVLYNEGGLLKYEVTAFSSTDWENKIYFSGLTLPGDALYKIRITAKADKDIQGIAMLNVEGKWDPRVTGELTLTDDYQTYEFAMTDKIMVEMNFELLMQFGFDVNEAPANIEFEKVQIIRLH